LACLLAALLCLVAWPSSALAGEEDILFNPVSRRDLDRMTSSPQADDRQSEAVRSLHAGYRREVLTLRARWRETKRVRSEDPQQAALEESVRERENFAALYDLVDGTDALTRAFFDDLGSLAGPGRVEQVEATERLYRRRVGMRRSVCGPERADLVASAGEGNPTRSRDFCEAMLDYERRLDELMKRKLRRVRVRFEELAEAEIRDQPPITEAIGEVLRKLTAGSLEIRDFNTRHARILRDLLPEAEQGAWTRAVNARSYPRVHGRDLTADAYADIRSVDGLSPDQLEAIDRIHERYRTEVTGVDARYVAALNRRHDAMAKVNVVAFLDEVKKNPEHDELEAMVKDRNALASTCVRRMLDVLTREQRAAFKHSPVATEASDSEDIMPLGDGDVDRDEWQDDQ